MNHGVSVVLALMIAFSMAACGKHQDAMTVNAVGPENIRIRSNVAVPMRDGVILRADVYLPPAGGPYPVLLHRTPYGKHSSATADDMHLRAVARGYAVVLQDVRGRYASEGLFDPYRHEGEDGYDSIEWAAGQAWSNGDVGTYGVSYPAAVQWLAAKESPPNLKAMAPVMTFSSPRNFFYMNGVFDLSWLPWIYQNIAPDARLRMQLPGITDVAEAREDWSRVAKEYLSFLPLAELPYLRDEAPFYFEWLKHPPEDSWWEWADIRGHYESTDAAVFNLSGWHDEAYGPEGAVTNHNGVVQARKDRGPARSHLVLGPWEHGLSMTGELDFGDAAAFDYHEVILEFFDEYLRGIDSGMARKKPVSYFVMGENRWRESYHWPPEDVVEKVLCLAREEQSKFGSLDSCEQTPGAIASSFVSDPSTPVTDSYVHFGPHDYASLQSREDLVIFETPELTRDVTVVGNAMGRIFVSCDCRDLDLWLKLLDVHPDGRVFNLMSPGADVLRASYRDPESGPQPIEPGKVYELVIDSLLTGNKFPAGHRIRIQVSGAFAPHLSRNLQTGQSEVFSSVARPASITIHHGQEHRSSIVLPVLDTAF